MKIETVYLDTCIYRDNFRDRKGRNRWNLSQGDLARRIMNAIKEGKYKLVVSDHLETQIKRQNLEGDYRGYKDEVKKASKLIFVRKDDDVKRKAGRFSQKHKKVDFEDAVHAELAIKDGADVIVTQDRGYFAYNQTEKKNIEARLPRNV